VTILRTLAWLPLPVLYGLAWLGYLWLYHVARYRRTVVAENLRGAFPELDASERRQLASRFYRQLADVVVEIIAARRMPRAEFARRVQVLNPQLPRDLAAQFSKPVMVLTLHQGNWEWMLHAASAALGTPMDPVYKPLHNRAIDRFINEVRSRFGAYPLPLKSAARAILKRSDHLRPVALVADQSPTRHEKGLWTHFLGREAAFHTGAESLARMTGAPVVFARCRRVRRGYYTLEFIPLAVPPYGDTGQAITLRYVQLAEQAIREEPESWLWSNRRWKRLRPAGEALVKD